MQGCACLCFMLMHLSKSTGNTLLLSSWSWSALSVTTFVLLSVFFLVCVGVFSSFPGAQFKKQIWLHSPHWFCIFMTCAHWLPVAVGAASQNAALQLLVMGRLYSAALLNTPPKQSDTKASVQRNMWDFDQLCLSLSAPTLHLLLFLAARSKLWNVWSWTLSCTWKVETKKHTQRFNRKLGVCVCVHSQCLVRPSVTIATNSPDSPFSSFYGVFSWLSSTCVCICIRLCVPCLPCCEQ